MEEGKRIRLIFRDDDILSDTQKFEGLSRSWVLLKPHHHDAVSDLASHLLHAFRLHQSCPHGLLLSIRGFVLPPFESTQILKDNEIISVRKRKDISSIEGNDAANDVQALKALVNQPVNSGALLLTSEGFEEGEGCYESDELQEESEDDDEGLLEVVENYSGANANKRTRKRKAAERLQGYKEKRQRSEAKHGGNTSNDVCKDKKDGSIDGDNLENRDEPAKHSDTNNVSADDADLTVDDQEKDRENDDTKVAPAKTKVRSRSARRKKAKRLWLYEMAKIQKQNATCESEGLRNWKEDQAKADRKRLDDQWKGQQKWKNNQGDAERNKANGHPKGPVPWKVSSQNNGLVKGKRHKHHSPNGYFLEHPNQNGDVYKQQNKKGDKHEHLTQMGDVYDEANPSLNQQPGQNSAAVLEPTNENCDASKQPNHESAEENEVFPILVRPGHIRFEPLEEEEQAVQKDHAPLETFNCNGITSKKKGQQWGKESCRFTPQNDCNANEEECETLTKENERQPNRGIDFDKLPPLPGIPKKGDLIAYRVLELSSTWTPELSAHRVGKVSWYNTKSNRTMLLPVPEYPFVSEKDDGDETAQPDKSLYKEDWSLEIDFLSLIDVRILSDERPEPGNEAVTCMSEASTGNVSALTTALPGSSGKPTAEPSPEETGGSVWDQLSESLNAKKEQLAKENGWGSTPKKVLVLKKPQPSSPGINWGKKAQKPQQSQDNSWGKQSSGSKSWSYKALRDSALGPTMAMLRSKNDT